ncbi:hypothetical protein C7H19_24670 [Aphanothece hegewaldii CCALA 016]|uniref:Uncharacterized protein n=1 Tax=Aphanothece hegewaldii CCALA 016 TaxID=2107694 RepID=A0A2T1LQM4_9CHRO|nr:hypothetical protein [Aphanothece hegewaldii]PSF28543.1 hypothetical protein C7H19_24670 [Aphanothece hegewaldii CCALA 016]
MHQNKIQTRTKGEEVLRQLYTKKHKMGLVTRMKKMSRTAEYLLISENAARQKAEMLHQAAMKENRPLIFESLKRASFEAMEMAMQYKYIRLILEKI